MDYNERIDIKRIKDFMREKDLSVNKFCMKCGIGYSTYHKIINNKNTYSSTAIFKIAKVMNIYAQELLNDF